MEMKLCKNSLCCYEKVYDAALNEDAAAEIVVPDSMPDIQDVLFAILLPDLSNKYYIAYHLVWHSCQQFLVTRGHH